MRVTMVELFRNNAVELFRNKVVYQYHSSWTIVPDEGLYKAYDNAQKARVLYDVIKLTDTVYRDDSGNYSGNYFLTEDHPFFNASMFNRTCVKYKLDNNFMISHLLEGVRYNVKLSLLDASNSYNERQSK